MTDPSLLTVPVPIATNILQVSEIVQNTSRSQLSAIETIDIGNRNRRGRIEDRPYRLNRNDEPWLLPESRSHRHLIAMDSSHRDTASLRSTGECGRTCRHCQCEPGRLAAASSVLSCRGTHAEFVHRVEYREVDAEFPTVLFCLPATVTMSYSSVG